LEREREIVLWRVHLLRPHLPRPDHEASQRQGRGEQIKAAHLRDHCVLLFTTARLRSPGMQRAADRESDADGQGRAHRRGRWNSYSSMTRSACASQLDLGLTPISAL